MPASAIGVVVVNWNGLADTLRCLESLAAAAPPPPRVVVVDNGSTDGSAAALARWCAARAPGTAPAVSLVATGTNLGFTGGNNRGVAELIADRAISHFLLLNNDATVAPAFFGEMGRALAAVPGAGIVAPTIYYAGRRDVAWYAGGRFLPLRSLAAHDTAVPRRAEPVATEFVTGCAMVISRGAWETLGPLPDCYFIYYEDVEYSWRAHAAGLPVVYAPRAVAYHAVNTTMKRAFVPPQVEYLKARNRALLARRNFRGWTRWGALAYLVVTKPGRALAEALRGRPALGWAVLRGTIVGLLSRDGNAAARPTAAA